jgi:hypothetical protein
MIQDLVTDILAPSTDAKELTFTETYARKGYTPLGENDLINYIEEMITNLENADPVEVPRMVAEYISVLGPARTRQEQFLIAFDYSDTGDKKYLKPITETLAQLVENMKKSLETEKMRLVTNSLENSFDLLDDIWGDDLIDNLGVITGAKKPTIKRWRTTGKINSRSRRKVVQITAVFYQMENDLGWDKEKISNWFTDPLQGSLSPKDYFIGWQNNFYMPKEIRNELNRLGISTSNYY